jgi:large subunit ribosomal protein LP0
MAALSLAIGYPTAVSVPHSVLGGFKNLVAISLVSGYSFPQAEALVEMAKDPSKFAKVAE